MTEAFIHAIEDGDWNKRIFSKKPLRAKRGVHRWNVYLVEIDPANMGKVNSELVRGRTFFSIKDGILFGAYVELAKLGKIELRQVS